ncbi:ABC transporter permease [Streptomyces canus]|uniref:ABC transporter permease n=1 Tax=Streptomyces canus TaxID=58343 RepID=UPI000363CBA9|nr:ABC transporter permease subunit [Streptomyces canus]
MTALAEASPSLKRRTRTIGGRGGPALVVAFVAVAVWWAGAVVADSAVVPTPDQSLRSLVTELAQPSFRASVFDTLRVLVQSYLSAAVVGAVVGALLGVRPFWSRVALPLAYAVNTVPKVTLFPIFFVFLGLGNLSCGSFAFFSGVLPMFLIAAEAARGVPQAQLKLAASLRVGDLRVLPMVVWPAVMPAVAAGLRLTFGFTFLGLIVAEMFAGSSGLGQQLLRNVALARMEYIAGEIVLIALLALVPFLLLTWLERRISDRFGPRPAPRGSRP